MATGTEATMRSVPTSLGLDLTRQLGQVSHPIVVLGRVKSLIPRLPTTFSPNPPANPALPLGTCPKHPKHVATPSHTLSGPANQALGCVIAGYSNFNRHGEDYFPRVVVD
eukprot:scaffold7865_cov88-Skeletonema_marinoi.AAC.1